MQTNIDHPESILILYSQSLSLSTTIDHCGVLKLWKKQNVTKRKVALKGTGAGQRAALHSAVHRSHCGLRSTAALADARLSPAQCAHCGLRSSAALPDTRHCSTCGRSRRTPTYADQQSSSTTKRKMKHNTNEILFDTS